MLRVGAHHATPVESCQASVRRVGFPLLPNFGGTFHSFTGTTLNAAVVDLLPLTKLVDAKQGPPAYLGRTVQPGHVSLHTADAASVRGLVPRALRQ